MLLRGVKCACWEIRSPQGGFTRVRKQYKSKKAILAGWVPFAGTPSNGLLIGVLAANIGKRFGFVGILTAKNQRRQGVEEPFKSLASSLSRETSTLAFCCRFSGSGSVQIGSLAAAIEIRIRSGSMPAAIKPSMTLRHSA